LLQGKDVDIAKVWTAVYSHDTSSPMLDPLAQLGHLIASIIANSGGSERHFSRTNRIHTKSRSRLGDDKVQKTAILNLELHREHAREGLVRRRLKRKFGHDSQETLRPDNAEVVAETQGASAAVVSVEDAIAEVLTALGDDEDTLPDALGSASSLAASSSSALAPEATQTPAAVSAGSSTQPRITLFFGTQEAIPLSFVFNFDAVIPHDSVSAHSTTPQTGLNMFWQGGLTHLKDELEFYDLHDIAETVDSPGNTNIDNRGGETSPLVVE
jgi:hypothetical protein